MIIRVCPKVPIEYSNFPYIYSKFSYNISLSVLLYPHLNIVIKPIRSKTLYPCNLHSPYPSSALRTFRTSPRKFIHTLYSDRAHRNCLFYLWSYRPRAYIPLKKYLWTIRYTDDGNTRARGLLLSSAGNHRQLLYPEKWLYTARARGPFRDFSFSS